MQDKHQHIAAVDVDGDLCVHAPDKDKVLPSDAGIVVIKFILRAKGRVFSVVFVIVVVAVAVVVQFAVPHVHPPQPNILLQTRVMF